LYIDVYVLKKNKKFRVYANPTYYHHKKNIHAHALRNTTCFQASTNMITEESFQVKFVHEWGGPGKRKRPFKS